MTTDYSEVKMKGLLHSSLKWHPANRHLLEVNELQNADEKFISVCCKDISMLEYGSEKKTQTLESALQSINFTYGSELYYEFQENLENYSIVLDSAFNLLFDNNSQWPTEKEINHLKTCVTLSIFNTDVFLNNIDCISQENRNIINKILVIMMDTQDSRKNVEKIPMSSQ